MYDQVELWAKIERAAREHPELPASFIVESLISMSEPREEGTPFVARSLCTKIAAKPICS